MNLHLNKNDFEAVINDCSIYFKFPSAVIEKDYYVTLFLFNLIKRDDNFIFKGGTCLQKAFHIIQRFSEDVDLSYPYPLLTVGRRVKIKKLVLSCGEACGFKITNLEETRSRRAFNSYKLIIQKRIVTL